MSDHERRIHRSVRQRDVEPFAQILRRRARKDGPLVERIEEVGGKICGSMQEIANVGHAPTLPGARRTSAVLVVWAMFAAATTAVIVTYSRLSPEQLYNVTGHGFVHGGLSRALVYLNFPVGLAAVAMLVVLVDQMTIERRLAAIAAAVLWTPVFSSRVLSQSHLDATWRNAIPAAGVAIAAFLTLITPAVRPRVVRGDVLRIVVATLLLVIALPWIAAELGLSFTGVPVLGQIFQTQELRYQPGPYVVHPAVHYGDHHGLEATLLVLTALLLSRMLGAIRSRGLHAASGLVCALLIAYGIGNIANDFWLEQVVKRYWTTHLLPNVLEPSLNLGWLAIVVATIPLWLIAFRPRSASTAG